MTQQHPSRPRIELDSDIYERYDKTARTAGVSLSTLVNMILRAVETVEVTTQVEQKKLPTNPAMKIRSGKWRIRI